MKYWVGVAGVIGDGGVIGTSAGAERVLVLAGTKDMPGEGESVRGVLGEEFLQGLGMVWNESVPLLVSMDTGNRHAVVWLAPLFPG